MRAFIKKNCGKTIGFLMKLERDSENVKKSFLTIKAEGRE
jgi:hypothetical protein